MSAFRALSREVVIDGEILVPDERGVSRHPQINLVSKDLEADARLDRENRRTGKFGAG
jgi:hypothetical protein